MIDEKDSESELSYYATLPHETLVRLKKSFVSEVKRLRQRHWTNKLQKILPFDIWNFMYYAFRISLIIFVLGSLTFMVLAITHKSDPSLITKYMGFMFIPMVPIIISTIVMEDGAGNLKRKIHNINVALESVEEKPFRTNKLISPDSPFLNKKQLWDTLRKCNEYIHWVDPYFTKNGFEAIVESELTAVSEIKILSGLKQTDEKLINLFKKLKKDLSALNIDIQFRVITDNFIQSVHDRWIISDKLCFNVPSINTIDRGQFSEIKETTNIPPFSDWWDKGKDVLKDYNEIIKVINSQKKEESNEEIESSKNLVKEVSLDKIEEKIMNSQPQDWSFDDEEGVYTFKEDVNLTIRRQETDFSDGFKQDWLNNFPDKRGFEVHHKIFYSSSFIEKIWIVGVDGFRSYIPYPTHEMTITPHQYKLGQIINGGFGMSRSGMYAFDRYLERAGISVKKEDKI